MKKLFVLLLLCIATASHAQKFELGVNAGISFSNKVSQGNSFAPAGWGRLNAPAISVKGLRSANHWQYGASVDYCPYSVRYKHTEETFPGHIFIPDPTQAIEAPKESTVIGSSYCIPVRLFADRKFTLGHFESYSGLSIGYVFWKDFNSYPLSDKLTYTAGVRLGTTYYLSKRIGINAEATADYITLSAPSSATLSLISIPITFGIRYRL